MRRKERPEPFGQHQTNLRAQSQSDRLEWKPKRPGFGGRQWSQRPLTQRDRERLNCWPRSRPTMINLGRNGKTPQEYLTENGLSLLKILALGERNSEQIAWYARENRFDFEAALSELRGYGLLDESLPELFRLKKETL